MPDLPAVGWLTAVHVPYVEPRPSRVPMAVAELALFIAAVGIWLSFCLWSSCSASERIGRSRTQARHSSTRPSVREVGHADHGRSSGPKPHAGIVRGSRPQAHERQPRLESPPDLPLDGLLVHVAGQSKDGFCIVDIFESEDAGGAVQRGDRNDPEAGIEEPPEFFPAHAFITTRR